MYVCIYIYCSVGSVLKQVNRDGIRYNMLQLYITWCDKTTLQEVTKPRFGSVLPWPLNHVIVWQKRSQVVKKLGVLGWAHKTLDEVTYTSFLSSSTV